MDQLRRTQDWARAAIVLLVTAALPALSFGASGPPWPALTPAQTLGPTEAESFPGPSGSPPATLYFGAALAVSGSTALAGMPGYPGEQQESGPYDEGAVAIFVRHGETWQRSGTLRPTDPTPDDFFGEAIALSSDLAAVQAQSGIYLFRRAQGGWRQVQKLVPPAGTRFDGGLALAAGTLFVGSPVYGHPGAVQVFEPGLDGAWHAVQTLASGESVNSDYFGGSLAAAGGTLVIGASGDDDGRGAAFVFRRRGSRWVRQQKLVPAERQAGASFGATVASSPGRIAIGAPDADYDASTECLPAGPAGAVYVFSTRLGEWRQETKITTPVPHCTESFGAVAAIDARRVVGATPSLFPYQVGAAYVYRSADRLETPEGSAPDDSLVSTPILELSSDTLFVGLPFDRGYSTGTVEVFDLASE